MLYKIIWLILVDIRWYAHAQLQGDMSLHVIVNIITFNRKHGLNYLLFGEQRLLFLELKIILMILHVMRMPYFKRTTHCTSLLI